MPSTRLVIPTPVDPAVTRSFQSISANGDVAAIDRAIAAEVPVAIEFNGLGYAVLMATPADLTDLAYGFARSERLIDHADDIIDVYIHEMAQGLVVRITIVDEHIHRVVDRVRHRVSESSCGLCGIENLEQALRPLPQITQKTGAGSAEIFKALDALRAVQPLNALTGGVHAAALCDRFGSIILAREDVGRHNAFDKLLGAMAQEGREWDEGFCLLSSRCSYELVEKAALADCPLLVTVSAPTALAISRARDASLPLVVLARSDAILAVHGLGEGAGS
jgi:FdhD protein